MIRRTVGLIGALALGLLAVALAADAQAVAKAPRIGFLSPNSPAANLIEAFRQGLREHGYWERPTIAIEYRWSEETRSA